MIHFTFKNILIILFLMMSLLVKAQESEMERREKRNVVAIYLGHAHVSAGLEGGKKEWLILPSIGLDYTFEINEAWSIGLQGDMVIQNFVTEKNLAEEGGTIITREKPISLVLAGSREIFRNMHFLLGAGGELEKNENLLLIRAGFEYGIEVNESWEVGMNLVYDLKWEAYDTWVLGIGIGKKF